MKTRHKIMSFLLSGAMVFSLLPASAIGTVKAASVNYALTATATASGSETSAFGPEKAKDGDATTKTSRWASEERDASESNPHWLAMDLGEVKTVNSVIITWERRNPTNYAIETSEDGSTWKAVKTFTSAPAEKEQIINLDNPVQTRYIRVRINTFNPTAEGITWKTVSIYEFEVYGEKQSSGSEVWDALNNLTVKAGDKKLNLPTVEGGKVEAYADYEQIVLQKKSGQKKQTDLTDQTDQINRKKQRGKNAAEKTTREYELTIPGELILESGEQITTKILKFDGNFQQIPEKTCTKWFDYDKIENTVQIRTRRPGDYLQVQAAGGHKKLKDYLINSKIPKEERDQLLLLAAGSHILWVIGQRISEAYKVTQKTKHILEVCIHGGKEKNE